MPDVQIRSFPNMADSKLTIAASFDAQLSEAMTLEILRVVCEKIAERYVEENYQAIAGKLSQEAIANLSVAAAAAKTRELLDQKLPERVEHVHHHHKKTEVYQRGILGGLSRIG